MLQLSTSWRSALILWLLCVLVAPAAQGETRALLVGVTGYPAIPERLRLQGPGNDVLLMRDVLLERGVPAAQIELLADGVAGAGVPSRAGILAAMDRLRQAAQPGDTVVLLLAGHGSRQPPDADTPTNGTGSDGWVKTFLPLDAGRWDGGTARVERALAGHELRRIVDAISARGANLFLMVDACQSAALVRGSGGLRWRSGAGPWEPRSEPGSAALPSKQPQPDDTLIGEPAAAAGAEGSLARGTASPAPGRTALYYAAQADQGTPEVLASPDDTGAAPRPHGLFTLTVAKVLRRSHQRGQPISYGQLAQQVMYEYATGAPAGVTPLLTGNGQDLPVLGRQALAVRQWVLEAGAPPRVAAGELDGLAMGSVLALLPDATARNGDALGYAAVVELGPHSARLQAQAHAGRAALDERTLASALVARVVSAPLPVSLRVALDRNGCKPGCELQRAAQQLQTDAPSGLALEWLAEPARAEVTLRQAGDRVQLLAAPVPGADTTGALFDELPVAGPAGTLAQSLARRLQAMARVRNLLRIAAHLPPADATQAPFMQLELQSPGEPRRAWPAGSVPRLRSGDLLHLTLRNPGVQGWDVTVLSLNANHGIEAIFPGPEGESPRLPPGARLVVKGGLKVQVPPSGIERLLMIAVPQRRLREPARFGFLAQPPVGRPRDAIDPDLQALFDAVFAPDGTARSGPQAAAPPADLVMQVYTADIRP